MADKDVVFNGDAFTDKGVTGNLAAPADAGILLNLNERSNLRFIADLASVEVDELGQFHIAAQLYVWSNTHVFVHRKQNLSSNSIDDSEITGRERTTWLRSIPVGGGLLRLTICCWFDCRIGGGNPKWGIQLKLAMQSYQR